MASGMLQSGAVRSADKRIPPVHAGMRIGLFGGSFNPPHAGHRLVAETALRRGRLDRVWWMVTPQSPLKSRTTYAPLADRLAATGVVARHPRFDVTALEAGLGSSYSAHTIRTLADRHKGVRFVWIIGADSLADLHLWHDWRDILQAVPILVVDRPGSGLRAMAGPAATAFARFRVRERDAADLADRQAPAWTLLHGPRDATSSTVLRKRPDWQKWPSRPGLDAIS